ncbi:MAG: 2Fe-2S iron-sulfur cluster binding domain-containing protein [Oleispira sp.]|nr:2Fe-2S iron-sulfur cluster binding domain-containing protein [Oleispira sp.]
MLSFINSLISKNSPETMQVNQLAISLEKKETVLGAALRNGINFPYSCKVGGCAECKCKLTKGKVKEFTDASYLLSAEEVQSGYILACQSVPKTADVEIEVDLSRAKKRLNRGKVIRQEKLTHDISVIELELDEAPIFTAGQYAKLSLECLPNITRAYSFASKPNADNRRVSFFIRHVPNGAFSSVVQQDNLVDTNVELEGPFGDFYLRDSDKPMLLIAGGSGLAPILSILEQAKDKGCQCPVTVLLGARTQADVYGLKEIGQIAQDWPALFAFEQILSEEPNESSWQGMRGYIGDHLTTFATYNSQVYLCGPPLMIDDCMGKLTLMGISPAVMFADRFITNSK